jgi:Porin subfamily
MVALRSRRSAASFAAGLLGAALFGLLTFGGAPAQAAEPVEYVKVCSLYGTGFYYIPGTDTCLRVGGFATTQTGDGYVCNNRARPFFNPDRTCKGTPKTAVTKCGGSPVYVSGGANCPASWGTGMSPSYVGTTQAGIELGVLFGHTGSNQDATLNTSFGTSNSGSIMDSANNVGFDARIRLPLIDGSFRLPQAQGPNVFAGYRFMSYYNEKGELVLNLHPTAGNDTFLRFRPDSSHTFYGGVGIPVFGPNVVPGIDQGMIDLYAGYRHVIGDITGSTNETGGGGGITPLGGKFNQNGWVFGGEFNVRTSALGIPVILGIGVDVAKLDGGSLSNNSVAPLAFNYNTVLPDRTETTIFGKVSVPLFASPARYQGDVAVSRGTLFGR